MWNSEIDNKKIWIYTFLPPINQAFIKSLILSLTLMTYGTWSFTWSLKCCPFHFFDTYLFASLPRTSLSLNSLLKFWNILYLSRQFSVLDHLEYSMDYTNCQASHYVVSSTLNSNLALSPNLAVRYNLLRSLAWNHSLKFVTRFHASKPELFLYLFLYFHWKYVENICIHSGADEIFFYFCLNIQSDLWSNYFILNLTGSLLTALSIDISVQ